MKYRVMELSNEMLDQAVVLAAGKDYDWCDDEPMPSTEWADAGPLIERERLYIEPAKDYWEAGARAYPPTGRSLYWTKGPTPLVAAMRAYVLNTLGEEVELP